MKTRLLRTCRIAVHGINPGDGSTASFWRMPSVNRIIPIHQNSILNTKFNTCEVNVEGLLDNSASAVDHKAILSLVISKECIASWVHKQLNE